MSEHYPDCMVDLETTGTSFDRTAIIQIAAVRFNFDTGEIDHDMFDRCLWIPQNRHWDEDTRAWWGKQKREVLQDILFRGEDPRIVLEDDFLQM